MKSITLIILTSSLPTSIQIIVSGFSFHNSINHGRFRHGNSPKDIMKRSTRHIDNTRNSNIIGMNNRWNSHNLIQMRQALNDSNNEGNDVDDDFSVSTTQLEINGSFF